MLHGWGSPRKARVFENLIAGLPPRDYHLPFETHHKKIGDHLKKGRLETEAEAHDPRTHAATDGARRQR
jgi:hypothetical protein